MLIKCLIVKGTIYTIFMGGCGANPPSIRFAPSPPKLSEKVILGEGANPPTVRFCPLDPDSVLAGRCPVSPVNMSFD